jgi:hypothetical protein
LGAHLQGLPNGWRLFIPCPERIAQGHGHIAQPALMADAAYGAALGVSQKIFFAPRHTASKVWSVNAARSSKSGKAERWAYLFQGQTSWQSSQP